MTLWLTYQAILGRLFWQPVFCLSWSYSAWPGGGFVTNDKPVYHYELKPKAEMLWFLLVAVLVTGMQALVEFDATLITDWRTWAVSLGSALVRAAAGAFLAYVARHGIAYDAKDDAA